MTPDDENRPYIDLHPQEYGRSDEPVPFWGFNAVPMLILFIVGMTTSALLGRVIYGEFPYWLQWLLE